MKKLLTLLLLTALPAIGQVNYGELRLKLTDPSGTGVLASVELTCAGNGYGKTFTSDASGKLAVQSMPYGIYEIQVIKSGFAPLSTSVDVRSALPVSESISLRVASVVTKVNVAATRDRKSVV